MRFDLTIPAAIVCVCIALVFAIRLAVAHGERRAKERTARLLAEARATDERAGNDA